MGTKSAGSGGAASEMKSSVRQIHLSKSDSAHFLRVDWEGRSLGSGFHLLLTDGQEAWRAKVDEASLRSEAEELEMQMQRYTVDLQEALTGAENGASYRFTLKPHPNQSDAVTLTYEKMQEDFSFRLGSVVMTTVSQPSDAVKELLVHNLRRGNDLRENNVKLQEENERLRREQQRITAELKRYAAGKEALEAELYSRFVLVLNEKKAKIRSLQEVVDKMEEKRASDKPKPEESKKAKESDEYEGSTEEEVEEPTTSASCLPSRESSTPSPLDDSLSDITDVAPSRKRRFRRLDVSGLGLKRANTETSQKKSASPAGSSVSSQRSVDAGKAPSSAEDLFDDF